MNLYERWSEDRQSFAKKGADIAVLIDALKQEVSQLASIDRTVCKHLEQKMAPIIESVKETVVQTATDQAKELLWQSSQTLSLVVRKTDTALRDSVWDVKQSRWQWFGITVAAAVLSSGFFSVLILPKAIYRLSSRQISLMNMGEQFTENLSRLSKKEQEAILKKLDKTH